MLGKELLLEGFSELFSPLRLFTKVGGGCHTTYYLSFPAFSEEVQTPNKHTLVKNTMQVRGVLSSSFRGRETSLKILDSSFSRRPTCASKSRHVPTQIAGYPSHSMSKTTDKAPRINQDIPGPGSGISRLLRPS